MEITFNINAKSQKEISTIKKILEALDVDFTSSDSHFKNPSPSNDKWFENTENLKKVEEIIKEHKSGNLKSKSLSKEQQKELLGL